MRIAHLVTIAIATEAVSAASSCVSDNCFRQLKDARYSASANAFCATYTSSSNPDPTAIPNYLANCKGSPSAVSSACSCLISSTGPSSSTTPTSTTPRASSTPAVSPTATLDCHQNNCIRALQNPKYSVSASAFCGTFTTTTNSDPAALPSYLSNCNGSPTSVSSACSCVVPAPTQTRCSLPAFAPANCGTTQPASGAMKQNFVFDCGKTYDTALAASTTTAVSSDDCLNICDSQPGCLAMTFDTIGCMNNCYLFSSLESMRTVPKATSDSATFVCAAQPAPAPESCGTTLTGALDSRPFQVQCGVAYTGASSLARTTASSYQDCFNKCDASSLCGAFTFDSSICFDNCQMLAYYDDLTLSTSTVASSGFTPANARDFTCGSAICGAAVNGRGAYDDGYLIACRSSYNLAQGSNVQGSPFTAVSFKDCLKQCDDNYYCNYMSYDSSQFTSNCYMFSKAGVSSDVLTANPNIDSAKALVGQTGDPAVELSPDPANCPTYGSPPGSCQPGRLTPLHYSTYKYTAVCKASYAANGQNSMTSTLTVNSFGQCLDACDKNNHCSYMTFGSALAVDNCRFISGSAKRTPNQVAFDSAVY